MKKENSIENKSNKERTLVLIKPDGIVKSLVGNIITALSETKLKIVGSKVVNVSRELAEKHYEELKTKKPDLFEAIIEYITGKHHNTPRIIALVYEGENAIEKVREICGETNPEKAHPVSLRGKYGRINSITGVMENVVHASDSIESSIKEIGLWFREEEIAKGE
jgi:nucleoside-diphosphate kinase